MTSTIRPSIHPGRIREPKITPFFISLIGPIFEIMSSDPQHQTYLKKKKKTKQNEKEREPTTIEHPPSHQQQESQPTQCDPNIINYKPITTAHQPYCTLPKLTTHQWLHQTASLYSYHHLIQFSTKMYAFE